MARDPSRSASRAPLGGRAAPAVLLALLLLPQLAARGGTLEDRPVVWYADDRRDIPEPKEREPNAVWDAPLTTAVRPVSRLLDGGNLVRRVGTLFGGDVYPDASNVNALDEVPNSSWFTNRIGLFPMSPEEAARGSGPGTGPDRSGSWTVVRAKTKGVSPGFTIRDAAGGVYLLKFDAPGYSNVSTAAGAIGARIFHAAGYFVPDDTVVDFRREDLRLAENVTMRLPDGSTKTMTEADLDAILDGVHRNPDGSWRAISSRFLSGKPVGPFDWKGRRGDDPNDHVNHQDRRELRGMRLIAAWINHFDVKQTNTLDMYVEEEGRHFVRHHLIDFASSLGAGALQPLPREGWEYTIDFAAISGRMVTLGLREDDWRKISRPEGLEEIGYFESRYFDSMEFKGLQPNSAFAKLTRRDAYWAAKIISAFSDAHLETIVATGHYQDPRTTAYMARTLAERRDKLVRRMFDRVPPLDFFALEGDVIGFHDLGAERGLYPGSTPRYASRVAAVTGEKAAAGWSGWKETAETAIDLGADPEAAVIENASSGDYPFVALECRVDRGGGWSPTVTAYLSRARGRIVAIER